MRLPYFWHPALRRPRSRELKRHSIKGVPSLTTARGVAVQSASPQNIEPVSASMTQSGLSMSATATPHRQKPCGRASVAGRRLSSPVARRHRAFWQRLLPGLALRHGDGDVRLKVSVRSDGSLRQIDLLESSGSAALDRAAVDTVEKLAPFAPFPQALARETQQLDIIRTWQFRR